MNKLLLLATTLLFTLTSNTSKAQSDTISTLYDFENLVNGNLNGQDNWVTTKYNTAIDFRVIDTLSSHPTKLLYFNQSGPSVGVDASRMLDGTFPAFAFDKQNSVYILEFDIKRNWWGVTIGLAADINNDGKTLMGNTAEKALMLSTNQQTGEKILLPNGQFQGLGNAFGNGWRTVQILINPFNGPGGKFSVGHKAIGGPFFTNLTFNSPLYVDTMSLTKTNISLWDVIFIHNEGADGNVDNIRLTKITPTITGVNEQAEKQYSAFYYDGMLHVSQKSAKIENLNIRIVDAAGREFRNTALESNSILDLQDLKSGWYCALIQGKAGAVQVPFYAN